MLVMSYHSYCNPAGLIGQARRIDQGHFRVVVCAGFTILTFL
uniref:Uncharacterized protein n=1 Tax=Anguilla anguilla TaxID=7936 RepID=A0A0E9PV57_ANGAN